MKYLIFLLLPSFGFAQTNNLAEQLAQPSLLKEKKTWVSSQGKKMLWLSDLSASDENPSQRTLHLTSADSSPTETLEPALKSKKYSVWIKNKLPQKRFASVEAQKELKTVVYDVEKKKIRALSGMIILDEPV